MPWVIGLTLENTGLRRFLVHTAPMQRRIYELDLTDSTEPSDTSIKNERMLDHSANKTLSVGLARMATLAIISLEREGSTISIISILFITRNLV